MPLFFSGIFSLFIGEHLFYFDSLYGLVFLCIERSHLVYYFSEVGGFQVDATYRAIVHRAGVNDTVADIGRRCPLGCTGYIGYAFSGSKFDTDRNIEVIEDLETLYDGIERCLLLLCRALVECCSYKA